MYICKSHAILPIQGCKQQTHSVIIFPVKVMQLNFHKLTKLLTVCIETVLAIVNQTTATTSWVEW